MGQNQAWARVAIEFECNSLFSIVISDCCKHGHPICSQRDLLKPTRNWTENWRK